MRPAPGDGTDLNLASERSTWSRQEEGVVERTPMILSAFFFNPQGDHRSIR